MFTLSSDKDQRKELALAQCKWTYTVKLSHYTWTIVQVQVQIPVPLPFPLNVNTSSCTSLHLIYNSTNDPVSVARIHGIVCRTESPNVKCFRSIACLCVLLVDTLCVCLFSASEGPVLLLPVSGAPDHSRDRHHTHLRLQRYLFPHSCRLLYNNDDKAWLRV